MRDNSQSTHQQKTAFSIFHVVLFVYKLETRDGGRDLLKKKKKRTEREKEKLIDIQKEIERKVGIKGD